MTPEGVHEQKAGRVLLSSVGVVGGGGDGEIESVLLVVSQCWLSTESSGQAQSPELGDEFQICC